MPSPTHSRVAGVGWKLSQDEGWLALGWASVPATKATGSSKPSGTFRKPDLISTSWSETLISPALWCQIHTGICRSGYM